jgi:L-Ala-D/L-Glu epimerase / N-acetyl-D-glutamate racemase
MHIDTIKAYRLQVPLTVPYRLAFGPVEYFDTVIVEMTDTDGRVGFGEATILTGYTDETIEGCWQAAQQFAREFDGDPAKLMRLGQKFPFTATAFGSALEMLNGAGTLAVAVTTRVPVLGLLNAKEGEAIAKEFQQLLEAGYRTIKVKVGFDPEKDARMVKAIQQAVKGRARIRIDANQGYSADEGVAFARALDPDDIELFEQPCAAGDWDAHLAVARVAPVPMMVDESIYGLADIDKTAKLKAAAYVKVKLMKMVTLDALVQAIDRIKELGMTPVLGNGVACDPGCWMEACVAAHHIGNAGEMNGFLKTRTALLRPGLGFERGAIVLEPGFAPRLDQASLDKHLVDSLVCTPRATSRIAS